jgi:tripartite-type tricarboxylate transporter receptor subunit TctC
MPCGKPAEGSARAQGYNPFLPVQLFIARQSLRTLLCIGAACWFTAASGIGCAQRAEPVREFPAKPVRIIVPYPAGGLGDIFPRALGNGLAEMYGQPVIIDNRPGASQMIGAQLAAKSPPDGYTLFFGSVTSLAINVSAQKNLPYDPLRDFAPVSFCFSTPLYLVVSQALPANSVKELIALSKSKPGGLTFASGGAGSSTHLAAELFRALAGINLVHIPYKGSAPAMTDVMAGHVDLMFEGGGINYVRDGKVRGLAVTSAKRSVNAPAMPTMQEAGVTGYEAAIWFGIVVPAATPPPIIARLSTDIGKVLNQPQFRERLPALDIAPGPPQAFGDYIRAEIPKWRKVIETAKITIE